MAAKILHKKSNAVTNGVPSLPSPSVLDYGEIAINYKAGKETISIKNDAGEIATFISSSQLAFEKTANDGIVSTLGNCSAATAYSFSVGESTITNNEAEHAVGKYNVSNTGSTDSNVTMHSVGIGTSSGRKNALEVMRGGEVYVYGVGNYDGTNANNNGSDPLQTYLEKNEYVIAASLNDLNSRCNELNNDITTITNSISSITSSMPDMSLYVPKSGTTLDKSSQLTFPGVRQENSITTIDSNGVSIDGDVYGNPNAALEANGVTFQDINNEYTAETSVSTNGVYIQLDDNSVNIGPEGLTVTFSGTSHSLNFPQTGGTIALTSDIPESVTALTSGSTNAQVPTAKAVYDAIGGIQHPTASTNTFGIVKPGSFIDVTDGVISVATGTSNTTISRGDHTHTLASLGAAEAVHNHTIGQIPAQTALTSTNNEVPTGKAVLDYVDGLVASPVNYKGAIVNGSLPASSSSSVGDLYIVQTSSITIASGNSGTGVAQTAETGDYIIARTSSTWDVIQKNLNGAVTSTANLTADKFVLGNGSQTIKQSTYGPSDFAVSGHSHTAEQVGALPTGTTLDNIADGSTRKLSSYVSKSGDTMDTGATLVLKCDFPDEGDGSTAYTNTISGSGISITDDWGSSVDLSKFGLTIQDSWYGSCVGLDYDGISFGSSPMVVKVLSFPQTGGTIALTSDIPQPVSALTSACTHSEVPSAKVVYDTIVDNEYVVATAINTLHTEKEDVSNKVTAITSSATQTQYPSAKAVYDAIDGITGLPAVTAADNGKILKVVNGAWALVDPVTIYSGASAPSSDLGEDGDIYLQTS